MRISLAFCPILLLALGGSRSIAGTASVPVTVGYEKLPLAFVRDAGDDTRYVAQGRNYAIAVDGGGATVSLRSPEGETRAIGLRFTGGSRSAGVPDQELPGKVNYIAGNDSRQWRLGLPTYARVTYRSTYPGIDVAYYGKQGELEFDLVLQPGADPESIRLRIGGGRGLSIAEDGALQIEGSGGDLRLRLPSIYQQIGGKTTPVHGRFALKSEHEVGFELDAYDRTKPLVIDPVFVYSGAVAGSNSIGAWSVAVDRDGNAYVTGNGELPLVDPAFPFQGGEGGYIFKINATGTTMLYSTYIAGAVPYGVAVDQSGAAWLTGFTKSASFPLLNAFQSTITSSGAAFVMKLDPSGRLYASTLLGSDVTGRAVATGLDGCAYVTGELNGSAGRIPSTAAAYITAPQGGTDGFAAKFNADGSLSYATYLGGAGADKSYGIAADAAGSAYVAGFTTSTSFPQAPAGGAQPSNRGAGDAFVAKIKPDGSGLDYFTFLGGSEEDGATAITVDSAGNAYVAGSTASGDLAASGAALQTSHAGGRYDGFIAKLNASGSELAYLTYLGANRTDMIRGLAVDSEGRAMVTGLTTSDRFPTQAALETRPINQPTSLFRRAASGLWQAFDVNLPGAVYAVSADPSSPGVILASTDAGVYRTTDNGATWTQASRIPMSALSRSHADNRTVYGISLRPPDSLSFEESIESGLVFQSIDGGITWSPKGKPFEAKDIKADGLDPARAYILTSKYLLVINDNGAAGSPCAGLGNVNLPKLMTGADGSVFVSRGYGYGSVRSSSGCSNWSTVSPAVQSVAVSSTDPAVWYGTVTSPCCSIYKSTDFGATWKATGGILPVSISTGFEGVLAADSSGLYVQTRNYPYLYRSQDEGATWERDSSGMYAAYPIDIVAHPSMGAPLARATVYQSAFVSKLNPSGSALVYSTFLGGSHSSTGYGIAASQNGDAIVAGNSYGNFPSTRPVWQSFVEGAAGFVVRISDVSESCSTIPSPTLIVRSYSGGQLKFDVVAPAGCSWTAVSDQPWASIIDQPGSGTGVVTMDISANDSSVREAHVGVGGSTITIIQASASCKYSWVGADLKPVGSYVLSGLRADVGGQGGVLPIGVVTGAGCPWKISNYYPSTIAVEPESGIGSSAVNLSVRPNMSTGIYSRTLYLTGPNNGSLAINQAVGCKLVVHSNNTNPDETSHLFWAAPQGGAGSFRVTGACSPANITNTVSWIRITSSSQVQGYEAVVTYVVDPNPGPRRGASFKVGSHTININQPASSCSYSLEKNTYAVPREGGTFRITVSRAQECTWGATGLPDWISQSISVQTTDVGTFTVASNQGSPRKASLIVAGQSVEVTQEGAASAGALAHLAAGDGWVSTITLVNAESYLSRARWDFFGNNGNLLTLPITHLQWPPEMTPVLTFSAEDYSVGGASLVLSAEQSNTLLEGSGQFFGSSALRGFALFRYNPSGQEAVVPLETRNAASYVLAFDNASPLATGVAVANLSAQTADITVIIRGEDGVQLGTGSINLSGLGHASFMLADRFAATAGTRGTVEFVTPSGGRIAALGLRANGSALTTIPVIAQVAPGGGAMSHLAVGDGWQTIFTLVNTGTSAAEAQLSFYSDEGAPISLPLTGRPAASTVTETLAPGGSVVIRSDVAQAVLSGSAKLTTTGNVGGFAIFRYGPSGQEAVVPLETREPGSYLLAFDNTGELATGIAVANLAGGPVDIPVTITDDQGGSLEAATLRLPASGHTSFMLTGRYSSTAGKRGVVTFGVPAGGRISVIGIRARASGAITTLPALTK